MGIKLKLVHVSFSLVVAMVQVNNQDLKIVIMQLDKL